MVDHAAGRHHQHIPPIKGRTRRESKLFPQHCGGYSSPWTSCSEFRELSMALGASGSMQVLGYNLDVITRLCVGGSCWSTANVIRAASQLGEPLRMALALLLSSLLVLLHGEESRTSAPSNEAEFHCVSWVKHAMALFLFERVSISVYVKRFFRLPGSLDLSCGY